MRVGSAAKTRYSLLGTTSHLLPPVEAPTYVDTFSEMRSVANAPAVGLSAFECVSALWTEPWSRGGEQYTRALRSQLRLAGMPGQTTTNCLLVAVTGTGELSCRMQQLPTWGSSRMHFEPTRPRALPKANAAPKAVLQYLAVQGWDGRIAVTRVS